MRSIEDKKCLNSSTTQEVSAVSCMNFEFHKSNGTNRIAGSHHRTALGKPTPSKWDDAQKWLVNLSRGDKNQAKASPRDSNADDRRLIMPVTNKDYSNTEEDVENRVPGSIVIDPCDVETKNVECEETIWRINKPAHNSKLVGSVCVRDMGTEMTPIASQEPSRTATPIRGRTPAARSPSASESSTPVRGGATAAENTHAEKRGEGSRANGNTEVCSGEKMEESKTGEVLNNMNPLEARAMAWDEAERAKYMARYKREEVKIQAWENHQIRKAEMEMRRIEAKAERLKARGQEKYTNKLAAARRVAEEKRAIAESKLNENAVKTSECADYIRRTGHLPSHFSLKWPSCSCSCCW